MTDVHPSCRERAYLPVKMCADKHVRMRISYNDLYGIMTNMCADKHAEMHAGICMDMRIDIWDVLVQTRVCSRAGRWQPALLAITITIEARTIWAIIV